jgi:hypothetical protein
MPNPSKKSLDTCSYSESASISYSTIYPTIEMPPEQVIFAENLENINLEQDRVDQSPLVTPTPGIAWIIKTQRPVSESIAAPDEEDSKAFLIPPVFEHQDFQNDGPAVLSAAIRFYGKTKVST